MDYTQWEVTPERTLLNIFELCLFQIKIKVKTVLSYYSSFWAFNFKVLDSSVYAGNQGVTR